MDRDASIKFRLKKNERKEDYAHRPSVLRAALRIVDMFWKLRVHLITIKRGPDIANTVDAIRAKHHYYQLKPAQQKTVDKKITHMLAEADALFESIALCQDVVDKYVMSDSFPTDSMDKRIARIKRAYNPLSSNKLDRNVTGMWFAHAESAKSVTRINEALSDLSKMPKAKASAVRCYVFEFITKWFSTYELHTAGYFNSMIPKSCATGFHAHNHRFQEVPLNKRSTRYLTEESNTARGKRAEEINRILTNRKPGQSLRKNAVPLPSKGARNRLTGAPIKLQRRPQDIEKYKDMKESDDQGLYDWLANFTYQTLSSTLPPIEVFESPETVLAAMIRDMKLAHSKPFLLKVASLIDPGEMYAVIESSKLSALQKRLMHKNFRDSYGNVYEPLRAPSSDEPLHSDEADEGMLTRIWSYVRKVLQSLGETGKSVLDLLQKIYENVLELARKFLSMMKKMATIIYEFLYEIFRYIASYFHITMPDSSYIRKLTQPRDTDDILIPESVSEDRELEEIEEPAPLLESDEEDVPEEVPDWLAESYIATSSLLHEDQSHEQPLPILNGPNLEVVWTLPPFEFPRNFLEFIANTQKPLAYFVAGAMNILHSLLDIPTRLGAYNDGLISPFCTFESDISYRYCEAMACLPPYMFGDDYFFELFRSPTKIAVVKYCNMWMDTAEDVLRNGKLYPYAQTMSFFEKQAERYLKYSQEFDEMVHFEHQCYVDEYPSTPSEEESSAPREDQDGPSDHPFDFLRERTSKFFGSFYGATSLFKNIDFVKIRNASTVMSFCNNAFSLIYKLATSFTAFTKYIVDTVTGRESDLDFLKKADLFSVEMEEKRPSIEEAKLIVQYYEELKHKSTSFNSKNPLARAYDRTYLNYKPLRDRARDTLKSGATRREPFSIHIVGAANVGKTSIVQLLVRLLLKLPSLEAAKAEMYNWDRLDYQDNYHGQKCINIEDMFNENDEETDLKLVSSILQIISNNYWPVTTADPNKKGKIPCEPKLFVSTSNCLNFPAEKCLRDPDAYRRRRSVVVEVVRSKTTSFMDRQHPYSNYVFIIKNRYDEMDHKLWVPMDFPSFIRYITQLYDAYEQVRPVMKVPSDPGVFDVEEAMNSVEFFAGGGLLLSKTVKTVWDISTEYRASPISNPTIRSISESDSMADDISLHSVLFTCTQQSFSPKNTKFEPAIVRSAENVQALEVALVNAKPSQYMLVDAFKDSATEVSEFLDSPDALDDHAPPASPKWFSRAVHWISENKGTVLVAAAGITAAIVAASFFLNRSDAEVPDFHAFERESQHDSGYSNIKSSKKMGKVIKTNRKLLVKRAHPQGNSHILSYYDAALVPLVWQYQNETYSFQGIIFGGGYILTNRHSMTKVVDCWDQPKQFFALTKDDISLDLESCTLEDFAELEGTDVCVIRMPKVARVANVGMRDIFKYFIRDFSASRIMLGKTSISTFRKRASAQHSPGVLMEISDPRITAVMTSSGNHYSEVITGEVNSCRGACGSLLVLGHDDKLGGFHVSGDDHSADFQPIDQVLLTSIVRHWDPKFNLPAVDPVSIEEIPDTEDQAHPALVERELQNVDVPVILEADRALVFHHRGQQFAVPPPLLAAPVFFAPPPQQDLAPFWLKVVTQYILLIVHLPRWLTTVVARPMTYFTLLDNICFTLYLLLLFVLPRPLMWLLMGSMVLSSHWTSPPQQEAVSVTVSGYHFVKKTLSYALTKILSLRNRNWFKAFLIILTEFHYDRTSQRSSRLNVSLWRRLPTAFLAYFAFSPFLFWYTLALGAFPFLFIMQSILSRPDVWLVSPPLVMIFIGLQIIYVPLRILDSGPQITKHMNILFRKMYRRKHTAFSVLFIHLAIVAATLTLQIVSSMFALSEIDMLSTVDLEQPQVTLLLSASIQHLIVSSFALHSLPSLKTVGFRRKASLLTNIVLMYIPMFVTATSAMTTFLSLITISFLLNLLKSVLFWPRGTWSILQETRSLNWFRTLLFLIVRS